MRRQTAVTAYFKNKQLPLFAFAVQVTGDPEIKTLGGHIASHCVHHGVLSDLQSQNAVSRQY